MNRLTIVAGGVIAALLLWFARSGWSAYFTGDDMMNLYKAWQQPYHRILLDNLLCFTPAYRPLGTLAYRALFSIFGLNPLPFRIFCFFLLLGNLYLVYRTAAALSSRQCGILCALFGCYNAGFVDLYHNTGTIYDLLCFTFYFLALDWYVQIRRRGRYLDARTLAVFLVFYVCALNSKEMAVTLPAVILIYELTLGRRGDFLRRWGPPALTAALTVPYVVAKFSGSSPLMGNPEYKLHLGLRTYFRAVGHYTELLAYLQPGAMSVTASVALISALGAFAFFGKQRRRRLFGWLFLLVTLLPVAFISQRSGYAMYIPSFGVTLYLAVSIVEARKILQKQIAGPRGAPGTGARRLLEVDTFLLCLIFLVFFHNSHPLPPVGHLEETVRKMATQIKLVQPAVGSHSKILILDDPFPSDDFSVTLALHLVYQAPGLIIHRLKMMKKSPNPPAPDAYDLVLTFDGENLVRLKP